MTWTNYTFTYDQSDEGKFKNIRNRLDPEEYTVIEERRLVNPEDPKYSDIETVMEMDPEAALTFRLGMKHLKIRRQRTEEELAEEKAIEEKNTVRITIQIPPDGSTPPATTP